MAYSAGSDRTIAVSLGVATVSGLATGLGPSVTTPTQLRLVSFGLFGGASIVFIVILIIVGVAVTTAGSGALDSGGEHGTEALGGWLLQRESSLDCC